MDLYKKVHLIRFENIQNDFNKICNLLDIPAHQLQNLNKNSYKGNLYECYDNEIKLLIDNKFKEDITNFNYEWTNNTKQ